MLTLEFSSAHTYSTTFMNGQTVSFSWRQIGHLRFDRAQIVYLLKNHLSNSLSLKRINSQKAASPLSFAR